MAGEGIAALAGGRLGEGLPRRLGEAARGRDGEADLAVATGLAIVAGRVSGDDAGHHNWCIVKVIDFGREIKEFEVLDEEPGDDEEGGGQRKHNVPVSHVIPFPKPNDPSSAQDFPPGSPVLAVYPGTTAVYKATVVNSRKMTFFSSVRLQLFMEFGPSTNFVVHVAGALLFFKHPEEDSYLLEFDDNEEDGAMPQGTVHFFNVVPLPEGHRR